MRTQSNISRLIGSACLGFLVLACGPGGGNGGVPGVGKGGVAGAGGASGAATGGTVASGGALSSGGTEAGGGAGTGGESGGAAGAAGGETGGAAGSETGGAAGSETGGAGGTTGGAAGTTGGGGTTGGTGGDGGLPGLGGFGGFGGKGAHEFIKGPSISSRGAGKLDVFAVSNSGGVVYQQAYENGTWLPQWYPLDGNITSDVDSVSWSANRVDLVGMGTDQNVYHKVWTTGWDFWLPLTGGSDWKFSPSAATPRAGLMNVLAIGANNHLYTRYWDGTKWFGWTDRGGVFTSAVDAVSGTYKDQWGTLSSWTAAVGKNTNNQISLWRDGKFADGLSLGGYYTQLPLPPGGGAFDSGPTICSSGSGRFDVFARKQSDQGLWHTYSNSWGNGWSSWEPLYGTLTSDPDCASWGPGRIDVVVLSNDSHVWHRAFDAGAWANWEDLGVF